MTCETCERFPSTDCDPRDHALVQFGMGTNHGLLGDPGAPQVSENGMCSYPNIAGCQMGETEEDAQALCQP
jgi:hypothetical protein